MFTLVKSYIPKSQFTRHVLTMMAGSGLAQVIPLIASPIITRLYSPSDFGEFALFFSWVSIIAVIATGRYDVATVLPETDGDAANIVALAVIISFHVTAICFAFIHYFGGGLRTMFAKSNVAVWLYYVPITIFIMSLYNTFDNWAIRKTSFRLLSFSRVSRNGVYVSVAILWGLIGLPGHGLVIGHISGFTVAMLILTVLFYKNISSMPEGKDVFCWRKIVQLAKKYDKFPKYMIASRCLGVISAELPVILLTFFYGAKIVGGYALAKMIMQAPVSLISRATADVFKQRASNDYVKHGNCIDIFHKTVSNLALISIIPFIIVALISPILIQYVFGYEWRLAGEFAQILALMCCVQFIVNPVSSLFIIAQKQHFYLCLQIYLVVGSVLSLYIGYIWMDSAKLSVLLFVMIYIIKYIVELFLSWRFAKGVC